MATGQRLSCGRDLCCVPDINATLEDVLKTGYAMPIFAEHRLNGALRDNDGHYLKVRSQIKIPVPNY